MAPSTAIGHRKVIIPVKDFIDEIINGAEEILKSWGFRNKKYSIL